MKTVPAYMCIRVLEDGERERATHFRVVNAQDFEEASDEIERLRARLSGEREGPHCSTCSCGSALPQGPVTLDRHSAPRKPPRSQCKRCKGLGYFMAGYPHSMKNECFECLPPSEI
jgi:hypothetical protein